MRFFFDESGDYSFAEGEFDCYVQAALICPDSTLGAFEKFVADRKAQWKVDELHATELDPAQLLQIATWIGESECQLLAQATDNVLITKEHIAAFRLDQAAALKRNLDWYRRESTKIRAEPVPEIEQWMLQQIKRSGLASQISHGEFVQAQFLVGLIASALQKSLLVYHEAPWREDLRSFRFVVDAKLPGKLSSGERYLDEAIVKTLGSRRGESIDVPETWHGEDPPHPFVERFNRERGHVVGEQVEGVLDLNGIFEHGIEFEESSSNAGLQLVDTVASVTRRAVLNPDDRDTQATYDALRPKLRNEEGKCLTVARLNTGEEDHSALQRYTAVFNQQRPT